MEENTDKTGWRGVATTFCLILTESGEFFKFEFLKFE
jgi:hypothetical protein